jgi:hypothetical protein
VPDNDRIHGGNAGPAGCPTGSLAGLDDCNVDLELLFPCRLGIIFYKHVLLRAGA